MREDYSSTVTWFSNTFIYILPISSLFQGLKNFITGPTFKQKTLNILVLGFYWTQVNYRPRTRKQKSRVDTTPLPFIDTPTVFHNSPKSGLSKTLNLDSQKSQQSRTWQCYWLRRVRLRSGHRACSVEWTPAPTQTSGRTPRTPGRAPGKPLPSRAGSHS